MRWLRLHPGWLLILDNMEQLVSAAADLGELLARMRAGDPTIPAGRVMQGNALLLADRAAAGADDVEQRVLLAVHARLDKVERLAAGLALLPKLVARRAPESGLPFLEGRLQGQLVDIAEDEHLARLGVLGDGRDDIGLSGSDFPQFSEVESESQAFFEFFVGHVSVLKGFAGSFKAGNPACLSLTHKAYVAQ